MKKTQPIIEAILSCNPNDDCRNNQAVEENRQYPFPPFTHKCELIPSGRCSLTNLTTMLFQSFADSLSFHTCLPVCCFKDFYLQGRPTGTVAGGWLVTVSTHSHLGAVRNGRTRVFLATEQLNQSSWGLSIQFNGTSTAAIEGGQNTIYLFYIIIYSAGGVQANDLHVITSLS